jgi:hypothetical protein
MISFSLGVKNKPKIEGDAGIKCRREYLEIQTQERRSTRGKWKKIIQKAVMLCCSPNSLLLQ